MRAVVRNMFRIICHSAFLQYKVELESELEVALSLVHVHPPDLLWLIANADCSTSVLEA